MDQKQFTPGFLLAEDDPFGVKDQQLSNSYDDSNKPFRLAKAAYGKLTQLGDDLFAREYSIKIALGFNV